MPSIMAVLGLNTGPFKAGLITAQGQAAAMGRGIQSSLGHAIGERLMQFASVAAVEETIRRVVELGDRIGDTAHRLGISTDAVQAWDYALKLNGSSIQAATGFFEKLAVSRQKALLGNDTLIDGYRRLGVSLNDLKTLRLEDIALKVASTFEAGDPQKLIADLKAIGGRGAGELAAAFSSGLPELVAGAKEAGVIMSEEVVYQLKEAADAAKTIWMQFLVGVSPAVSFLAKTIADTWHDANVLMRGAVGFLTGGFSGAKDLMHEYDEETKRVAKEQEERRKKKGNALVGGAEGIEEESKATKHAKEILKLQEQLAKLQNENDLKRLDTEDQIDALWNRRLAILQMMKSIPTEEGKLKAAIDIETIDKELKPLMTKAAAPTDEDKRKAHTIRQELNSLQRIGGMFVSSPLESSLHEIHRKTEHNTRMIFETLKAQHVTGWQKSHH